MTREYKTFQFQLKSTNDEEGIIEGYLSVFSVVDQGLDRVIKGAFKRTLANSKKRAKDSNNPYLFPMLWQHDETQPIGGVTEAKEDDYGLFTVAQFDLDTQRGREAYSGYKKGYLNQLSIGYDVIRKSYDDKGVRNLEELRLWEQSTVTFAMNEDALVTGVKAMDFKTICGNTSGAIGPRDESWDAGKAEKQIWAAAEKDDGSISASVAKKYFMVQDGDASKKGSYSYPFWYVGSSPHICVGAVKAIAGAIQGARGASAPDGLKSKVEKLYNRINKKYPDAEKLTPPWSSDDGKGRTMPEKKDFSDRYRQQQIQSWLSDFYDLYYALKQSIWDAFASGDEIEADLVDTVLNDSDDGPGFITALKEYVQEGIDLDYASYLQEQNQGQSVYASNHYGLMSSDHTLARKAGRAISAANASTIQDHIDNLHAAADEHKSMVNAHCKAIHTAADDLASVLQGSEPAYTTDHGTPEKSSPRTAPGQKDQHSSSVDTAEIEKAHAELVALRTGQS